MNIRFLVIYLFVFCSCLGAAFSSYAQAGNADSLYRIRAEQKRRADSLTMARKRVGDSLAVVRKYRESKRYKDSVTKSREERIARMTAERKARTDSATASRKHVIDSAIAARKVVTDEIKARQKQRMDSFAAIKKYKESKRFRDSVIVVKRLKKDSLESVKLGRPVGVYAKKKGAKAELAARPKTKADTLLAKRRVKTDSLAMAKVKRQKAAETRAKEKEQKMQLALELKIKKKHEAWSNESMLKKKWSFPRQVVQNTFTRFNYYFNSDRKMDEALENMQRVRKTNYDSLIALYPFDPDRDSSILAPDMDSIIQKASLGIQIHDPRTKWGDDLYLLMGQAYFYKGKYQDAATAFRYILSLPDKSKKKQNDVKPAGSSKTPSIAQAEKKSMLDFLKHKSVHNEAILWLARTYTQAKQEGNAESVLDLLNGDPNFPKTLQGRLALEKANILLNQNDPKAASVQLEIVAKDDNLPAWVRERSAFLNGQLLQQMGKYDASAENFRQVIAMNPKIDMDFYARKNLANSMMMAGGKEEDALSSLEDILNDGKYTAYYEQVYYIMGRLSANKGDNEQAIKYLDKSIGSIKSTKRQKAYSFAALGNVYYKMGDYFNAKNSYDSSVLLVGLTSGDSIIQAAARRTNALGSITGPYKTVHDNDSLLVLAVMTEREKRNAIRSYIRKLEEKRADSIFKAENAGLNNVTQNQSGNPNDNAPGANWYFMNPMLMQQGNNDFKRKWGNRPLADNWRRLAAMSNNANDAPQRTDNSSADVDDKHVQYDENGLPTEESLLALIPTTDEEKEEIHKAIRKAYMDMSTAYIKNLEDYPAAIKTLDTLDKRYPGHEYAAEALYLRYLAALRQTNLQMAQNYSRRLIEEFPNSKYAELVRPTEDSRSNAKVSVADYYDETYDMLIKRQYSMVLIRARDGQRRFSDPDYKNRFIILEGLALAGSGEYNKADTLMQEFVRDNGADPLRNWADAVLRYINANRPLVVDSMAGRTGANGTGVMNAADGAVSADMQKAAVGKVNADGTTTPPPPVQPNNAMPGTIPAAQPVPANYTYKPQEEHYVMFAVAAMEQRAMGVKAGIADFNTFKFGGQNLSVTPVPIQAMQSVILIKSFRAMAQAKIYMNVLKSTDPLFREYKPGEYDFYLISASNYLKLMSDKDIKPYASFYKSNYK